MRDGNFGFLQNYEPSLARLGALEAVPQNPNDEPDSALLERIRAQRAAAPRVKRGRRATVGADA